METKFNNPLIIKWLTSFLRTALKAVAGVLIAWGWMPTEEGQSFVAEWAPEFAGLLLLAGTQGYSMWVKWFEQKKLVAALVSPPGTTEQQIENKIASGVPVPAAATPKNVVPVAAPPAAAGQP